MEFVVISHLLSSAVCIAGFVHFQLDFMTVNSNDVFFLKEYGISNLKTIRHSQMHQNTNFALIKMETMCCYCWCAWVKFWISW